MEQTPTDTPHPPRDLPPSIVRDPEVEPTSTVPQRPVRAPRTPAWVWRLALGALAIPLAVERGLLIARRPPTGADETLYLMQALDWLGRLDKLSRDYHRTRGVPALIYPVAAFTDGVWAYRISFAVLGLVLCALTFWIGRQFMGRIPAAFAAVMLGLNSTVLNGSVLLLPDLPAAVCVATAFALYWRRVVRASPTATLRWLWPIGLAVGAAFYFNMAFAAFAGLALALDFLLFRRRDLFTRATFEAAFALGAVIGPYFLKVELDHGTPLYTILRGLRPGGTPGGEPGYRTYIRLFWDPNWYFGKALGIVVIAGAALLVLSVLRGAPIPRRHAAILGIWLTVPTAATAVLFHAEARYLLPWLPAAFLALAIPFESTTRMIGRLGHGRRVAWIALAALLVASAARLGVSQFHAPSNTMNSRVLVFGLIHRAAATLGQRFTEPPCQVFTRYPREFELETGCATSRYNRLDAERLLERAEERPEATYFVTWAGLVGNEGYQPKFLDEFLRRHAQLEYTVIGPAWLRTAYVYRFVPSD